MWIREYAFGVLAHFALAPNWGLRVATKQTLIERNPLPVMLNFKGAHAQSKMAACYSLPIVRDFDSLPL